MSKYTREEFLKVSGLMAAGLGLDGWPASRGGTREARAAADGKADTIVVNGRVFTVDDALPRAEAFAVKNGRFMAVGSTSDIRNLAGPNTKVVDASRMTVVPGFMDCHCHPTGVEELVSASADVRSIAEIKQAMRAQAAKTPPGYWVRAVKYDDTKLTDGRALTRKDLDEAVPDHPAVVGHRGGHTGVYNSAAFKLAGITAETPDPTGGKFYRENGELTGKVAERARGVFSNVGKSVEITRESRQKGVALITSQMAAAGLTSVHNVYGDTDTLIATQDAYRAGELRTRVYYFPGGMSPIFTALKDAGIHTGFGDEWLRIGAVKFVADGSASERTMAMSTPYVGRPDDYGILTMNQDEVNAAVEDAHRHDFQIGIHANGDVTINLVLNAYERAQKLWPRPDVRHRIEHCTLVNPEILRRIKAGGFIPTPFWTYVYFHGEKWVEYGEEKVKWMFAHRSFLDYGIPVAGASDYMPGPFEPMMALQSMVTRTDYKGRTWGANQKVTVAEALRIGTQNGAHASFEENQKGSITAGKLADFVVLEKDPHEVDPSTLKDIKVVMTVAGGKATHEA